MRVLLLESHPGVGDEAVTHLISAGHTVERCDSADRHHPCRGLAVAGECPLDEYVDVAVLAQEPGVDHVEHGAVCAARDRVPVVEIDPAHANRRFPASVWTSVAGRGLLDECERAARDGSAHARAVVDRLMALGVIAPGECGGENGALGIRVERGVNRLVMTIELGDSKGDRDAEIVRAATQALRDFDRRVAVIDVLVRNTSSA